MRARSILIVTAVGMLLYAYPGLMTADSADQLDQARRWSLGDWHPPTMALLWRLAELFIAGPFGMLLIQVGAFLVGTYALLRSELSPCRAAIATCVIGWFPPVLTVLGVIWKDCHMAAFAILGIAALVSNRPRMRWFGLGALVIAGAMRHNAAALTFVPVMLLWARDRQLGTLRRALYALAVWIAITMTSAGINAALARKSEHAWVTSVAMTDVIGTLRWAPPLSDHELKELLAGARVTVEQDLHERLSKSYTERGWLYYVNANPPIAIPETEAERAAISGAWYELVTTYPAAYLTYRWKVFRRVIRLGDDAVVPPISTSFMYKHEPELAQRLSHAASKSGVQRLWFRFVRWFGGVFYLPYVYLVLALALLPLAWHSLPALAILCSGICYELPLFFIAPSEDYRYSHWLVVTTLIGGVMIFAMRWRDGRSGSRRQS